MSVKFKTAAIVYFVAAVVIVFLITFRYGSPINTLSSFYFWILFMAGLSLIALVFGLIECRRSRSLTKLIFGGIRLILFLALAVMTPSLFFHAID